MEAVLEKRGYNITAWIGKGAFSNCYEVTHNKYSDETFVAKVFKCSSYESNENAHETFKREASMMLNPSCMNIIKLYDYFSYEDQFIFILENCKRGSLAQVLQKKKLCANQILKYTREAIEAIAYLHVRGIVHHDIKPANFLIDNSGRLKLCDFGLSYKYHKGMIKRFGGTYSFNPPEVIKLTPYDPFKADIWALGCTIYCMAIGTLPFIGETKNDTSHHIINGHYELPKDLDPNIRRIINMCLEYHPKDRATASELVSLCQTIHCSTLSKTQISMKPSIASIGLMPIPATFRKR